MASHRVVCTHTLRLYLRHNEVLHLVLLSIHMRFFIRIRFADNVGHTRSWWRFHGHCPTYRDNEFCWNEMNAIWLVALMRPYLRHRIGPYSELVRLFSVIRYHIIVLCFVAPCIFVLNKRPLRCLYDFKYCNSSDEDQVHILLGKTRMKT